MPRPPNGAFSKALLLLRTMQYLMVHMMYELHGKNRMLQAYCRLPSPKTSDLQLDKVVPHLPLAELIFRCCVVRHLSGEPPVDGTCCSLSFPHPAASSRAHVWLPFNGRHPFPIWPLAGPPVSSSDSPLKALKSRVGLSCRPNVQSRPAPSFRPTLAYIGLCGRCDLGSGDQQGRAVSHPSPRHRHGPG